MTSTAMAAQREGFPYGSRWGFRTPSPDFARTAVEPLSPYPTSTPICYTRESSISNDNAPSSTSSIPPQYPSAVPLHNAQEHHLPAQAVANNSYNPPHIASEIPPSNPLDTLADIALLHGAGQLTSSHCIPPSHSPVLPTEGFRGPDYHHIGGVTTIPVGPSNVRRNSLHETSYGPIGYERRAHSTGREIEFINTPIPRRPSITLSELLSPQEEPPLEYSEARGLPRGNAFSRSPEMARSSTAAYSDQRLLPAASGADIRVNGYTSSSSRVALVTEDTTMHDQQTTQPEQPLTPVQNQSKEDHLALDSASTSLPTPTQEDHVIASSVASGCDQSEKMKTGTNLTPECTEAENLVKASASNQSVVSSFPSLQIPNTYIIRRTSHEAVAPAPECPDHQRLKSPPANLKQKPVLTSPDLRKSHLAKKRTAKPAKSTIHRTMGVMVHGLVAMVAKAGTTHGAYSSTKLLSTKLTSSIAWHVNLRMESQPVSTPVSMAIVGF